MNSTTATRRSNGEVSGRGKLADDDARDVPPHSIANEEAVIGAAVLDGEQFDRLNEILGSPWAFYSTSHRLIWLVMRDLRSSGRPIDVISVRDELTQRGMLLEAGGAEKLHALLEAPAVIQNSEYYAGLVRRDYDKRQLIQAGRELVTEGMRPDSDPEDLRATLNDRIRLLEPASQTRRTFAGVGVDLLKDFATCEPEWLVDELFTIDEPLLFGARSKGCKTLQLTDLAVALATGTPWMGVFEVPKRRKVLFISGETNNRRMARHTEKACRARGGSLDDLGDYLRVEAVEFPCLPSVSDQEAIRQTIERHGIEVVIVDPLYRGLDGLDATQLGQMGGAIKGFQAACSPACLILSHHVVKSAAREYGSPPSLEDMTGAGIAESCGQWWLVGRNEKYAWNWLHDLCVSFGGREGQAGGKRIVFNESDWTFAVENLSDFISEVDEERRRQQETAKRDTEAVKLNQARVKILKACQDVKTPQSRSWIRDTSGQSRGTFAQAFSELTSEQSLLTRPYRDGAGRVKPEGYILADYATEYDRKWGAE